MKWPDNKKFAFTIFDDTDQSTLRNTKPVYDFLYEHGLRTTKSVWIHDSPTQNINSINDRGSSCEDDDYREWLLDLHSNGFEIALHNVRGLSSKRETICEGIERFKEIFGGYPKTHTNHNSNTENIHWGMDRLSGINKYIYSLLKFYSNIGKNKYELVYQGHNPNSNYFWGDVCKDKIKYVRNFVFNDINTLNVCPMMPYQDEKKKYVNYWYASSNGGNLEDFNILLREENQDRLEREGGLCIAYTHFAKDFYKNGNLNKRFTELIKRLSQKDGWFVPVSTVLDYMLEQKKQTEITKYQKFKLETRWLLEKVKFGSK